MSKLLRCAIYTRKSTDHNLDLAFTYAQREACEAYIKGQAHEGWRLIPSRYDDGAFSGASLERPSVQKLLTDVRAGQIDVVLVLGALSAERPRLQERHALHRGAVENLQGREGRGQS